ncbi:hypothetical protein BDN70DRAFT_793723 [Pholiota conissans]|uniref:Copper homeostasis protein cutC homolog n=1 Tax=Pholiota conissans TaxID=109636 RepID=A0A9P5ZHD9_9AGAR|nr:hypothetical protein BDN70DRAFT_793723 [Pholiota conissans]
MTILPEFLIIEVCVDSVESAISATRAGADRLEVCANLGAGGGTTPTVGLVKSIQRAVDLPLMVMIRPRTGDFLYSNKELDVILEDVKTFKELGNIRGFVVGALTKDGHVDIERMKIIVDEILPLEGMTSTTHPLTFYSKLLLLHGHCAQAPQGLSVLQKLFNRRKELVEDDIWGLTVMPGSGVNGKTLPALLKSLLPLGLREIHLSGGRWVPSTMSFKRDGMGMGINPSTEWEVWCTQADEVQNVRRICDIMWQDFIATIEN